MQETAYILALVTAPSNEIARQIARSLVEQKLAACVNLISPVTSIYNWEGRLEEDQETLLLIKTRRDLFEDRLIPAVRALHPYQIPEIIATPIQAGLPLYLSWIEASTT